MNDLMVIDQHRLTKFEKCPTYAGRKPFNSLPREVTELPLMDLNRELGVSCYSVSEVMTDFKLVYRF